MPTILGVNFGREFFGWPEALEKQGRKIRYQNSPSEFAEKFAGNFPKIRWTKSALQNLGLNNSSKQSESCNDQSINRALKLLKMGRD